MNKAELPQRHEKAYTCEGKPCTYEGYRKWKQITRKYRAQLTKPKSPHDIAMFVLAQSVQLLSFFKA